MKRVLATMTLCILSSLAYTQIEVGPERVEEVLCQKWSFKAIIMFNDRLTNMDESIDYEFLSDGTFVRVNNKGKKKKGTWTYDPESSRIELRIKRTVLRITALNEEEFSIFPLDENGQINQLNIGTVFQPTQ
ncbi:MAG: hypothetical protein KTR13_01160 [Saprospiraceae bacterium]|nr:hypothetical protein [Saprospiraceae bacterium]